LVLILEILWLFLQVAKIPHQHIQNQMIVAQEFGDPPTGVENLVLARKDRPLSLYACW
jgi:hypothetical protein